MLPIAERELRVAARAPRLHSLRLWTLLGLLGFGGALYLLAWTGHQPITQIGRTIFKAFSIVLFIAALGFGFVTADALSREKREGTMGLLFLTDLRGHDVVIGKLCVTSLHAIYGIFGAFPILSLPLLMGGVSGTVFVMTQVAILNTVFFSVTAGLFVSSLSLHLRKAMLATGVLIALLTFALPALCPGIAWCSYLSPATAFSIATDGSLRFSQFWKALGSVHLLGWGFLAASCAILPRSWTGGAAGLWLMRWQERVKSWCLGQPAWRQRHRARILSLNPVCWLDDRHRLQKSLLWGVLFFAVTVWGGTVISSDTPVSIGQLLVVVLFLHYSVLLWIAAQSAHSFAEDRQNGALELLLVTPMTVREIIHGRLLALRRQFLGPLLFLVAFDLAMLGSLFAGDHLNWAGDFNNLSEFYHVGILLFLAVALMLLINAWSFAWLGLWLGLTARSWGRAVLGMLLRVPALHAFLFVVAWLLSARGGFRGLLDVFSTMLTCWFVPGALISLGQALWSRQRLLEEFRELAGRDSPGAAGPLRRRIQRMKATLIAKSSLG